MSKLQQDKVMTFLGHSVYKHYSSSMYRTQRQQKFGTANNYEIWRILHTLFTYHNTEN